MSDSATAQRAANIAAGHSSLDRDVSAALRLKEYESLAHDLSIQQSPGGLLTAYRSRFQYVIPADRVISLSRRNMQPPALRITRSTTWSEEIDPWKDKHRQPVISTGLLADLMDAGRPLKIDNLSVHGDDPAAEYVEGMSSLIASPIYHDGAPIYMVLMMRRKPAAFTLDELCQVVLTSNLIGQATGQMALAEELRQAYAELDREFATVGRIQRELLPANTPDVPGLSVATHYETSTRAGGDYYDFRTFTGDRWGFLIADVSGHGAAAAVVMSMIYALLHSSIQLCPNTISSPIELLSRLNAELAGAVTDDQFVTAFLGVYDANNRSFAYASAGHNPPRLMRADGQSVIPLQVDAGVPLGVLEAWNGAEACVRVHSGDRILLYTDGVTETFNDKGEMFGTEGLDAALRAVHSSPQQIIDRVRMALEAFTGGERNPADDRTMVALAFE